MKNIEFYITPKGDVMLHTSEGVKQLKVSDREFISEMLKLIGEFYPEALTALSKVFVKLKPVPVAFEFNIVRRFIKCNSRLSERELEVMNLYYNGVQQEEIADHTCLSVATVRTHKRNAFRRVKVHSLAEFFTYAKQHNLFEH